MRLRAILGIYLCALAVWAQLLAPAAALAMDHAVDPFAVICAKDASGKAPQPAEHHHGHNCCLVCHAQLAATPADARPVFTTFDYPVTSPLRWQRLVVSLPLRRLRPGHRPRDPPALV